MANVHCVKGHCERPEWAKERDYPQWDCPADNPGCYAPACAECEWWKEDGDK